MLRLTLAVKRQIAVDIHLLELRPSAGGELPAFTAGAHVPVRVPNGRMRRYSLCNDPAERDRYCMAVKREATGLGGSISLIDDTVEGCEITAANPRNEFELDPGAPRFIFIAGGIGVTPMRSMMNHLMGTDGRAFELYYLTRSPEMTAFRDEFAGPAYRNRVVMHHDGGDPARAFDLSAVLATATDAHIYCCGPKGLMNAVRTMTSHWPSPAVHFEDFNSGG